MGTELHCIPSSRVGLPLSASYDVALFALEELRQDLHDQSRKLFFQERFVSSSDVNAKEQTVRNCISLLRTMIDDDLPTETR